MVGLDIGAQGGFNSDDFFPKKYNHFFQAVLVDPLSNSLINESDKQNCQIITTEKDFYRVRKFKFDKLKYLKVKLEINEKEKLVNKIINYYDQNH